MKALPKKLLPLILFGIAVTSLFSVRPAQAYTVTLEQLGSNVVANGSGAIDLNGLNFVISVPLAPGVINASFGIIQIGDTLGNFPLIDKYTGFTGPTSFGSGIDFGTDIGSGDAFGIDGGSGNIDVPHDYVSGTALSNSITFNNASFATLGLTPGTYIWMWGDGADQRFTLQIGSVGVPGVPDGGSTVSLLGFGLLGLAALRHKLSS
jgi:hypothetical protein